MRRSESVQQEVGVSSPVSLTLDFSGVQDRAYSLRGERHLLTAEFRNVHFECTSQINEITL